MDPKRGIGSEEDSRGREAATVKKQKSWQHPKDFPSGPPPQYYPGPAAVNFGVLKRSGVFATVWPPATDSAVS